MKKRTSDAARVRMAAGTNLLTGVLGILGVLLSFRMNGAKCLGLYTDETCLLAAAVSFFYAADRIKALKSADSAVPAAARPLRVLRYCSVCSFGFIFVMVLVSLLPAFHFSFNLLSGHLILMHFVCPLLSAASFLLWERDTPLRRHDVAYSMIYTIIYIVLAAVLLFRGVLKTKAYPFLSAPGTPLWVPFVLSISLLAVALLISFLIWAGSRIPSSRSCPRR